jgi:uncharacterized protein YdhG (YjbR/CyaY superfamily)
MAARSSASDIDSYIAEFPPEVRALLEEMRALIREAAPEATETISYSIPTFDLAGRHLVHFAAFKTHLSFYPTGGGADAFRAELGAYAGGRGTVQLPYDDPLPADLIRRIVRYRVERVKAGER